MSPFRWSVRQGRIRHGALFACAFLSIAGGPASAADSAAGSRSSTADAAGVAVFPPGSRPFGKSYVDWLTEWGQFTMSVPPSASPVVDTTGQNCMVGQRGPVWLLGSYFNLSLQVSCTIPQGQAIAVGWNQISIAVDCTSGQPSGEPAWALRRGLNTNYDSVSNASISVDGVPIPDVATQFRIKSKEFAVWVPEDNLLDVFCPAPTIPAGVYPTAVGQGIFVILEPLSAGAHTIRVQMDMSSLGWHIDNIYNVNIAAPAH